MPVCAETEARTQERETQKVTPSNIVGDEWNEDWGGGRKKLPGAKESQAKEHCAYIRGPNFRLGYRGHIAEA